MIRALAIKELRETAWIGALALVINVLMVTGVPGLVDLPSISSLSFQSFSLSAEPPVPFVNDGIYSKLFVVGLALAIGLGFRQSIAEFARATYLFLLHRPRHRTAIFGTKLIVGATLVLVACLLPLAIYTWWAATPGTHPSPFFWSLTVSHWWMTVCLPVAYFGAFLSGLRPGRWFGTRLWPLAASLAALALLLGIVEETTVPMVVPMLLLMASVFLLVWLIRHVSYRRDFS